jgi:hypothetical protein
MWSIRLTPSFLSGAGGSRRFAERDACLSGSVRRASAAFVGLTSLGMVAQGHRPGALTSSRGRRALRPAAVPGASPPRTTPEAAGLPKADSIYRLWQPARGDRTPPKKLPARRRPGASRDGGTLAGVRRQPPPDASMLVAGEVDPATSLTSSSDSSVSLILSSWIVALHMTIALKPPAPHRPLEPRWPTPRPRTARRPSANERAHPRTPSARTGALGSAAQRRAHPVARTHGIVVTPEIW